MLFKHFRLRDEYTNEVLQKGGLTFAVDVHENEIYIGMAECNIKDMFCKKTGREIATSRISKGNYEMLTLCDLKDIMYENSHIYFKGVNKEVARNIILNINTILDMNPNFIFEVIESIVNE